MIHRRLFLTLLVTFTLLAISPPGGAAQLPKDGQRIVFLGDSITHGGTYITYLDTYLRTRFPNQSYTLINLGLSSETASGRSEPDHPFPRPCIHDRLDRALAESKPDYLIACYGMNDGIYHPPSDAGMKAYQDGISQLIQKARDAGAQDFILMTPPIFDPTNKKVTTPIDASLFGYKTPYEHYNDVLSGYAAWIRTQHTRFPIAAIHEPMKDVLNIRRRTQRDFVLAKDGVHPQGLGHLIMAIGVIEAWTGPLLVDSAKIDAKKLKSNTKGVSRIKKNNKALSFIWQTKLPMPMDPAWDAPSIAHLRFVEKFNNHLLTITGLAADQKFALLEDGIPVGQISGAQLAAGVNLVKFPKLSTNTRALELLALVKKSQANLHAAWLKHVGHSRADKSKAPPLKEALAKAALSESAFRSLAKPTNLNLTIQPVAQ